jgi:hypothetical protein
MIESDGRQETPALTSPAVCQEEYKYTKNIKYVCRLLLH